MEEARRLATLQKKRELKAAGIEVREQRRRKGIDYSKEVAFERAPVPGFYDVGDEIAVTREMREEFKPVTIEELEGRKRRDIEAALIKQDVAKAKMLERQNAPAVVARALAAAEAATETRRGKMMLPAPQITDAELEALARGGEGGGPNPALMSGGSEATRQLLGDYATPSRLGATPARTALRTPTAGVNRVMADAQALMRLQQGQTPLLGGENPDIQGSGAGGMGAVFGSWLELAIGLCPLDPDTYRPHFANIASTPPLIPADFSGITPRAVPHQTPNPLAAAATPSLGGKATSTPTPGATPSRATRTIAGIAATPSLGSTPARGGASGPSAAPTPLRDALGLNDTDTLPGASRREEAARMALARNELRAGLMQLPAAKNEYQVVVPELQQEEGGAVRRLGWGMCVVQGMTCMWNGEWTATQHIHVELHALSISHPTCCEQPQTVLRQWRRMQLTRRLDDAPKLLPAPQRSSKSHPRSFNAACRGRQTSLSSRPPAVLRRWLRCPLLSVPARWCTQSWWTCCALRQ
jgi:pre-mRNA-splicing factor CDC5/CEF1